MKKRDAGPCSRKYRHDPVKDAVTVRRFLLATTCLFLLGGLLQAQSVSRDVRALGKRVVIAADSALDGKGGALGKTRIVIEGSKIVAIDPKAKPIDYDLRGLTVLPGWIDAHVHLTSSFGSDGKFVGGDGTTHEDALRHASNAWVTLMGGFTTVQSMGPPSELVLRDAIASGSLPGPRILTAAGALSGRGEQTGTPEEIRDFIRKQKQAGADLVKIYAAGGFRTGEMTLSQEQLNAACDEANKQGLRTLVHAFREAVRAATLAGCTQIEHGVGATDDDLKLMAERGTYLDPQAGLLWENYLLNANKFAGTPFFPKTVEGFASMKDLPPVSQELLRRAGKIPGLKIVFGTDALSGMHGRNAEEFIHHVRNCGVDPTAAMISANSLAAEALGMGRSDRLDRAWSGGGHHCAGRRPPKGHYRRSACRVCDEGWHRLQELRTQRHSRFCTHPALIRLWAMAGHETAQ
jgi:imidazolonepropionase-like amidohydrolase